MFEHFWRHTVPLSLGALQRSLTYYPDHTRPTPAEAGVPELAPVTLETEDGLALLAWHAPPRTEGAPSLIYFHGNAGHIGMRSFKVRAYLNAGLGILLTTWRGYSGNPGTPTEDGLYADGRAARDFLRTRGVDDERQILYGESLGTGVAVHLAREAAPAALVLEAPYSSIADIASGRFPLLPVGPFILDRFDSAAKIGKVEAPLLIVHGERDRTIPVRLARKLHRRAREPKEAVFIPEADHADLTEFGLAAIVLEFLTRHDLAPESAYGRVGAILSAATRPPPDGGREPRNSAPRPPSRRWGRDRGRLSGRTRPGGG